MNNFPSCFQKAFFNDFRHTGSWKDRFMYIHPGVEAYLRQILFVGLRRHGVNYADATKFVYENRLVEGFTTHFPVLFNSDWNVFIQPSPTLSLLWDLYENETQPVRNRVFHGMRDYSDELFQLCYSIDIGLIEAISHHLNGQFQHDFLPPLKSLNLPRVGRHGVTGTSILGRLRRGRSPRYSSTPAELAQLRQDLRGITIY